MMVMMMVMMMSTSGRTLFISQSKPNVQQDVAVSRLTRMCHSPKRLGVLVMIGTQCGRSAGIEIGSSDGYHSHGDYVLSTVIANRHNRIGSIGSDVCGRLWRGASDLWSPGLPSGGSGGSGGSGNDGVSVGLFVSVCWLAHLIACLLTLFVACYCGFLLSLLLRRSDEADDGGDGDCDDGGDCSNDDESGGR